VRQLTVTAALLLAALGAAQARAQGFAALVSPPRFELTSKPGATVRQVIEISNRASTAGRYHIHTSDFVLGADYGVAFHDELVPGSCRPWVAIERPTVTLPGGGTIRYRFEVQVPADAEPGECRFAIMIEGDEPSLARAGQMQLPVTGRIGVIVYVTIGDAQPQIEMFGPEVVTLNGRQVPALRVHNSGTAHTRMSGFLTGKDATGRTYDFTPSDFPILPGEIREVFLTPSTTENPNPILTFPVSVQGTLEWANQSAQLDERFK